MGAVHGRAAAQEGAGSAKNLVVRISSDKTLIDIFQGTNRATIFVSLSDASGGTDRLSQDREILLDASCGNLEPSNVATFRKGEPYDVKKALVFTSDSPCIARVTAVDKESYGAVIEKDIQVEIPWVRIGLNLGFSMVGGMLGGLLGGITEGTLTAENIWGRMAVGLFTGPMYHFVNYVAKEGTENVGGFFSQEAIFTAAIDGVVGGVIGSVIAERVQTSRTLVQTVP
jgi:hypothetical protein